MAIRLSSWLRSSAKSSSAVGSGGGRCRGGTYGGGGNSCRRRTPFTVAFVAAEAPLKVKARASTPRTTAAPASGMKGSVRREHTPKAAAVLGSFLASFQRRVESTGALLRKGEGGQSGR